MLTKFFALSILLLGSDLSEYSLTNALLIISLYLAFPYLNARHGWILESCLLLV